MWCLESPKGDIVYNLTPGKIHTVSRKAGDIVLAQDVSVSRKHAFLEVKCPITDGVSVWDENSKYGTFVNEGIDKETRIQANEKVTIKEGGLVRFGLQHNIWKMKREPPCVCLHMLKPDDKRKVKSVISQIGGKVVENWSQNPSHLTTTSIRLTFEVMCALVSGKQIVTPQFWDSLMGGYKGNPGELLTFIPPVIDKRLSADPSICLPNPARKSLFKDKLFIFPSSQSFNVFKSLIELAGGKAGKLSDCNMSLADYCKPHVVVLNCSETEQTSFYNKVLSTLIEKDLHVIPEEDIGLAIWKVSTTKYCNPSYVPTDFLRKSHKSRQEMDTGETLVMNTEDIAERSTEIDFTERVIPPSFSDNNLFTSEDRTMSMSVLIAPNSPAPGTSAGPSRKRSRDSNVDKIDKNSVVKNPSPVVIKIEPESLGEEDLFADEVPLRSSAVKKGKKPNRHEDSDEEFLLPSPPKKKSKKQAVKDDDDCDLFNLPEEPPSFRAAENKCDEDDDEFEFLSRSSRLNKTTKASTHNESRDLFETQEASGATSTSKGKRKERGDSDQETPPSKRPPKDVTNSHLEKSTSSVKLNFVKKEVKTDPDSSHINDELSSRFHTNVIVTSLLKRDISKSINKSINKSTNTTRNTTDSSVPNFKKFRKNWSGSSSRHCVTTSMPSSRGRLSNGDSADEEEEESFLPSRAGNRRNNVPQDDDDDDDEFALPSFSQV